MKSADSKPEPLLLDTHCWIWLLEGTSRMKSSPARPKILAAARHSGLYVSAISVWELGMLEAHGRLALSVRCEEWVQRALSAPGIRLAELSPEIAIESSRLPGEVHGDPADRMLIATARKLGLTLVTSDRQILKYAALGHLRALAC